jgi:hypothetical protein
LGGMPSLGCGTILVLSPTSEGDVFGRHRSLRGAGQPDSAQRKNVHCTLPPIYSLTTWLTDSLLLTAYPPWQWSRLQWWVTSHGLDSAPFLILRIPTLHDLLPPSGKVKCNYILGQMHKIQYTSHLEKVNGRNIHLTETREYNPAPTASDIWLVLKTRSRGIIFEATASSQFHNKT